MPWDGSGNFTLTQDFPQDRDLGRPDSLIDADKFDAEFENIAAGLENCWTRDGQNEPTDDIPMGGFSFTGMRAATAADEPIIGSQVSSGAFDWIGVTGGTANALTGSLTFAPTLAAGVRVKGIPALNNTGAATFALNGGSTKDIKRLNGDALQADDIVAGRPFEMLYNGTHWRLTSLQSGTFAASPVLDDLGDVVISSATNGDYLKFNGTSWVNTPLAEGIALGGLSDVAITTPASGQQLVYNGSGWVNGRATLDDLSDATVSGSAAGEVLGYDGSVWRNRTVAASLGYTPANRAGDTFTGVVTFGGAAGDEGGEIRLQKPVSGTTLSSDVVIDIKGDALRIFDVGGTNKGVQFSLASLAASAGSTLWNSANDGAGSGLDADLLDGQQGSYYTDITARLGYTPVNKAGDTMTGALGITAGSASAPGLFFSGDTNTGIWSNGADTMNFTLGGTNFATMGSGGKLSLGTSYTGSVLNVGGLSTMISPFGSFEMRESASGNGFRWTLNNNGTLHLQHTTDGFSTASTPYYVDASDNIGISNFSPAVKLDVAGDIKASGYIRAGTYLVASLPAAPGNGSMAACSDTTGGGFGVAPTGGGATVRPVHYSSSAGSWLIG